MASMFNKATSTFRKGREGSGDSDQVKKQDEEGESLTTILQTAEDRSALTILIADITELMRKQLVDTFDANEIGIKQDPFTALKDDNGDPIDFETLGDEEKAEHTKKIEEKQKSELAKREKEVSEEKMVALNKASLHFFDDWRDSVLTRVGAVVNSPNTAQKEAKDAKPETTKPDAEPATKDTEATEQDKKIDEKLSELYPPVENELKGLPKEKRALVLHSALLLMLSLEHYNAHSRVLLLYLATSLGLSVTLLAEDESKVAQGLLEAVENMNADDETKQQAEKNSTARKWKVGLAGVAGAALIGVTGGLAAPLLAAGIGSVMGGLGLGATAAAGYLGTLAGSSVLVGGLFGAYGGRMTSKVMDQYAKEVEDFAFIPVRDQKKTGKSEKESRRLRVAIGVSGYLQNKDEVVTPWRFIGAGQESFALRFELEALMNLGNALTTMVTSAAWSVAKTQIIKHTVFAALTAGLWPLALVKASRIIDNPWSVASYRAQKAGEVLADALINKAQGERPVTLIGYSLGAKVVYTCLQQLAQRQAFGLVENVIMIGAPTPCSSADWRRVRSVVSGRVVNGYSTKDYILAFLYRSSSIQLGVAGLEPVVNVKGVENVDVSDLVEGHTMYRHATGPILQRVGFEDIDMAELEHQRDELKKQEQEEKEQREAAEKGDDKDLSEEEVKKMEKEVEEKNKQSNMDWMTEKMKLAGSAPGSAYEKAKERWNSRGNKNKSAGDSVKSVAGVAGGAVTSIAPGP